MATKSPSYRVYHAALLDYILGSGESGLARAYELGRTELDKGCGFLDLLLLHAKALNSILESTSGADEVMRRLNVSAEFLLEALAPFEMAFRGYRALLKESSVKEKRSLPHASVLDH